MPRHKKVEPIPAPEPEPKKPARSGANLNTYVDDDIRKQMDAFIAAHNLKDEHPASLRSTIEAAIKMYLKAKGFWPPGDSA